MLKGRHFVLIMTLGPILGGAVQPPALAWGAELTDQRSKGQEHGQDYIIGPGDLLSIEVWKDPALTRTVVVLPDGRISFPLIGDLVAGGRSVADLKQEVETKIIKYVPDTYLTLEVKQSNSMHVYVLGRVNNPGRLVLNSNITALQALAMAGGLTPFAKRGDIRILRQEKEGTSIYPFDYDSVTSGEALQANIVMKRGDVIFVP